MLRILEDRNLLRSSFLSIICYLFSIDFSKKEGAKNCTFKIRSIFNLNFYKNPRHARGFLYLGCSQPWTSRRRAQGWRERTNITKTGKMQSIFPERVSAYGVPENACHFWGLIPIRVKICRKLAKLCIGEIALGRADGVGVVKLDKGMNVVAVHCAQKAASCAVGL